MSQEYNVTIKIINLTPDMAEGVVIASFRLTFMAACSKNASEVLNHHKERKTVTEN